MEKQIKHEKETVLLVWTLITLATLGMIWQGLLVDKISQAVVVFIYYIGMAMNLNIKK